MVTDWNAGLVQTALGRVAERRREAGRRSREVTMTDCVLLIESDALTKERLEANMSFNAKETEARRLKIEIRRSESELTVGPAQNPAKAQTRMFLALTNRQSLGFKVLAIHSRYLLKVSYCTHTPSHKIHMSKGFEMLHILFNSLPKGTSVPHPHSITRLMHYAPIPAHTPACNIPPI